MSRRSSRAALALLLVLGSSSGCAPVYSVRPSPYLAFQENDVLVKDGKVTTLERGVCGNAAAEADAQLSLKAHMQGIILVSVGGGSMLGTIPLAATTRLTSGIGRAGVIGAVIALATVGVALAAIGSGLLDRERQHRHNAVNRYNAAPTPCPSSPGLTNKLP